MIISFVCSYIDIVYKPVFAKKDSELLHPDPYDDLEAVKSILHRCCVIYFECSTQILAERLNSRGDELVTVDQLEEIKNNYRSTFAILNLTPYSVDTGKMTPEEVYTHVKGIIEYEESKNSSCIFINIHIIHFIYSSLYYSLLI